LYEYVETDIHDFKKGIKAHLLKNRVAKLKGLRRIPRYASQLPKCKEILLLFREVFYFRETVSAHFWVRLDESNERSAITIRTASEETAAISQTFAQLAQKLK
jgi:hypothetical protein